MTPEQELRRAVRECLRALERVDEAERELVVLAEIMALVREAARRRKRAIDAYASAAIAWSRDVLRLLDARDRAEVERWNGVAEAVERRERGAA